MLPEPEWVAYLCVVLEVHACCLSSPRLQRPTRPTRGVRFMVRVLLADDHAVIRRQLGHILAQSAECEVCGEATNGRAAVEMAIILKPAVVVLDIEMPEMNGFDAARRIREALPGTEVVIITAYYDEGLVIEALAVGARSYVRKSDAARHLREAVVTLARHEPYFTAELTPLLLEQHLATASGQDLGFPGS